MVQNQSTWAESNTHSRGIKMLSGPDMTSRFTRPSGVEAGPATTSGRQVRIETAQQTSLVVPPTEIRSDFLEGTEDSAPLQVWEGTVLEVRPESNEMAVNLDAKMGEVARYTMDIGLEFVAEQDKGLVRPGAVFYLTFFTCTNRNRVETFHELRFRRLPPWSARQIKEIEKGAARLRANIGSSQTAP